MTPPNTHDTIVAIATAAGRGAIGIIRVSGSDAVRLGAALLGGVPPASHPCAASGFDGGILDEGMAVYFPAPASLPAKPCWSSTPTAAPWCWTGCCSASSSSARNGPARPIHRAGLPQRQARSRAGRSRCRSDRRRNRGRGARRRSGPCRANSRAAWRAARRAHGTAATRRSRHRFSRRGNRFLPAQALEERRSRYSPPSTPSPPPPARAHCCARIDRGDRRHAERRQVDAAQRLAGEDIAIVTRFPGRPATCCGSRCTSTACP